MSYEEGEVSDPAEVGSVAISGEAGSGCEERQRLDGVAECWQQICVYQSQSL